MATKKGKTLGEFNSLFDRGTVIPSKIRAALVAMAAEGKENWDYELDFIRRAGVSAQDLSQYREKFSAHVVEVRQHGRSAGDTKRVWFASPAVAARARNE